VRSEEACYKATARAVELAEKYNARLHVAHLTTARELSLFSSGSGFGGADCTPDVAAKRITAEVCIPHLWFSDADYARLGNRIKCNPAIKTAADRDALRKALITNKIDLIATDHAPHTSAEKSRGYWDAPSGIPSVQHSVSVMFELASQGVLTLETVVEKMCHAPAVRFGIAGRGFLRPGYMADIAIVDPAAEWVVEPSDILYKCGWSPFEGVRFGAKVVRTIIGGRTVWDGKHIAEVATGEILGFTG
jgi:dihydroorotase